MDYAGVTASGDSVAGGLWEWFKSYTKRGGASWGEYYLNGKIFDRANWATFDVAKEDRLAPIDPCLLVDAAPRCGRLDEGSSTTLKASVEAPPDSGVAEHAWLVGCVPSNAAACAADATYKAGSIAEYEISVRDERGRTGRDRVSLRVDAPRPSPPQPRGSAREYSV